MLDEATSEALWLLHLTADDVDGWGLFDTDGDCPDLKTLLAEAEQGRAAHPPLELQKVDESDRFDSDAAAWRHVARRAIDGSAPHSAVWLILAHWSPAEYGWITGWLRGTIPHSSDDPADTALADAIDTIVAAGPTNLVHVHEETP